MHRVNRSQLEVDPCVSRIVSRVHFEDEGDEVSIWSGILVEKILPSVLLHLLPRDFCVMRKFTGGRAPLA